MAKHLIVTTEAQDEQLRIHSIPISQVIQLDGPESTVFAVNHSTKKIFARMTSIDPEGTVVSQYRYYVASPWSDEEPNNLNGFFNE